MRNSAFDQGSIQPTRRRGSAYVMVLGMVVPITVIGLSAITLVRLQRDMSEDSNQLAQARLNAQSAIEKGFYIINNESDWRTAYPNGVWEGTRPITPGTYSLEGRDPADGDLANSETGLLELKGVGIVGEAHHASKVTLVPQITPLQALNTCMHAGAQVQIKSGKSLTVIGAPLSTNGDFQNDEILYGDVHAASVTKVGTVTGTMTIPAAMKTMPEASVLADYVAKATPLGYVGDIKKKLITPVTALGGATNADGLYYFDCGGSDRVIEETRLHGTLIVNCPGKKLTIQQPNYFQNFRSDYPVLIVNGSLEIKLKSSSLMLQESTVGLNFNPIGSGFLGLIDLDLADQYPNEIRGLVHVNSAVSLYESTRVRGTIIAKGGVVIEGTPEIIHNSSLYTNPPQGYIEAVQMKVSPGSWKQDVN